MTQKVEYGLIRSVMVFICTKIFYFFDVEECFGTDEVDISSLNDVISVVPDFEVGSLNGS